MGARVGSLVNFKVAKEKELAVIVGELFTNGFDKAVADAAKAQTWEEASWEGW
eukprot:CAMPEP_0178445874 /NCGR_PEP_ID=MMETSP0689_2-20121128/40444_1 /TAXON_ID=160604 /ORGANISM="Amphidinium massartii, Strain CS-259" /LENGTH=52 /DNA_ID=CAMNT_0020070543 /DNA_START=1 /DNA_END=159 /DNA_ORIENTATION=+